MSEGQRDLLAKNGQGFSDAVQGAPSATDPPGGGSRTRGSHLRLLGVPRGPDAAPWRQVGAGAAHANEPAARRADWPARIPAAFPGREPRPRRGAPPAAAAPGPRSGPPSSPRTPRRVRGARAPARGAPPLTPCGPPVFRFRIHPGARMTIRHQGQQYRPRMAFLQKVSQPPPGPEASALIPCLGRMLEGKDRGG
ncbi:WW domain-binding protein 11-like [Neofelis nebulosa]|uniref:WW domain-binding protein 11-like n=1 Tax=Neofelis nebulosa TaxID=61452 RepID=UPI00272B48AE|nr:WW domain-binding protein 11-like [Neofelis nebulosa]